MLKFIMLIGLPASGKDTWAREYLEENPDTKMYSSDAIREELYGNEAEQGNPQEVFGLMRKRTIEALKKNFSVIYNATNVAYKDRKGILQEVKNLKKEIEIIAHIFAVPVDVCKKRNSARERKVPDFVYDKMLCRWQTPCNWEGFDLIEVDYNDGIENFEHYRRKMMNFDQQNHHHSKTLGHHCLAAQAYLAEKGNDYSELAWVMRMHDVGKLFTKSEPDEKGDCHYYSHENYGAYIVLLCNGLKSAQLVNYHMLPYNKNNETWRKRMGETFWNKLLIMNEADRAAH